MIMPKDKLSYLGNCIRQARNDCNLTQQDLADQSHVAIKTIQMIEKGKINPSYEILYPLIKRLGISANTNILHDGVVKKYNILKNDREIFHQHG